ncbi:MAG: hypothetical protein FWH54_02770 [Methanobrevibacter sp.]|nr:hypothetical protein [Methanobrevibacter sp.]
MNKKKMIILAILFLAVVGLALNSVSAAGKTYKTGKLYFKYNGDKKIPRSDFTKKINNRSEFYGYYNYPNNLGMQDPANYMKVGIEGKIIGKKYYKPNYKPTKVYIMFKKTVKGKTYYSSKTFTKFVSTLDRGEDYARPYTPKNNYKPYYAIFYYKKV